MAYFLISISNRTNLNLCIKYALAGFTNSINGLWTYTEIKEGDYVSFLYGARVFNLYKVIGKKAFKDAEKLPPWPPVYFSMSRRTYYFPFRLFLKPVRKLNEPMVRPEFAYVAENLLLRGGYRRTHFQADSLTYYSVSQMGEVYKDTIETFDTSAFDEFMPKLCFDKNLESMPEIFYFQEVILQSLIRHYLSQEIKLQTLFEYTGNPNLEATEFEVLGEKAFPEGHIDILIKDIHPKEKARKIIVEVKKENAKKEDIRQLKSYIEEIKEECIVGILISKNFPKKIVQIAREEGIVLLKYSFENLEINKVYTFDELLNMFKLHTLEGDEI